MRSDERAFLMALLKDLEAKRTELTVEIKVIPLFPPSYKRLRLCDKLYETLMRIDEVRHSMEEGR
jgi:hypothetical protein